MCLRARAHVEETICDFLELGESAVADLAWSRRRLPSFFFPLDGRVVSFERTFCTAVGYLFL